MTVNRFNPVASAAISLSENGGYVRYEDYMALMDELETEKSSAKGRLSPVTAGMISSGSLRPNWKPQRSA
ncbi:hypothetical protein KUQ52_004105 [Salmonella enterica]|nr:hypothetical protein [Salmonella enterica]